MIKIIQARMTPVFTTLLLGAALSGVAGAAEQQERPRAFAYLGAEVSYYDIHKERFSLGELDDFVKPAGQIGYRFWPRFSAQFQYGQADTETDIGSLDVTHRTRSLVGRFHVHELEVLGFHPYLGLGYAYQRLKPDNLSRETQDMGVAEAGIQRFLGQHLMLDVGMRGLVNDGSSDDRVWDQQPYLALNYVFGQRYPAPPPAPEPEPEPAPQEPVWVDSDGDGVPDHLDKCPGTPAGAKVDEHGCPLMLTETVNITLYVEFEFDSTSVPERFKPEIAEVAKVLVEYPDSVLTLEGHTDNVGSARYNQNLSQSRADAVMRVLVSDFNIAPSRIETKGMGLSQPIADNSTEQGRARNRRVEAVINAEREVMQKRD